MFPVEVCDWDQNHLFTVRAHLGLLVKKKKQINNTQIEGVATVLLFEPHVNQVIKSDQATLILNLDPQ